MEHADRIVLTALAERVFVPGRVQRMLEKAFSFAWTAAKRSSATIGSTLIKTHSFCGFIRRTAPPRFSHRLK